jgi:hypothetical protein
VKPDISAGGGDANAIWKQLALAAFGAILAVTSDLLLVAVQLEVLSISNPAPWKFALITFLGSAGIGTYAIGYPAAARLSHFLGARERGLVVSSSIALALVAVSIHAYTGYAVWLIANGKAVPVTPLDAVFSWGRLYQAGWIVAVLLVLLLSMLLLRRMLNASTIAIRIIGSGTPAILSAALCGLLLPYQHLREILIPLIPNVAHMLFFAACAAFARRRRFA